MLGDILEEEDWQSLVLRACDDDGTVMEQWDSLWARFAGLGAADVSGELRYRALVVAGLELMLGPSVDDVSSNEGGGQSIQAEARFQHLHTLLVDAKEAFEKYKKGLAAGSAKIAAIATNTLSPPAPGYVDPGSPIYTGDPRYVDLRDRQGW